MNFQRHAYGTLLLAEPTISEVRDYLEHDEDLLLALREAPDCGMATSVGIVNGGWAPFMSTTMPSRIIVGVQWLAENGLGHFLARGVLTQ